MNKPLLLILAITCLSTAVARAEKAVGGPRGGRLLETAAGRAEFVVNAARKAEIRFYTAALEPVAPAAHVVAVTAEPPAGRVKLELDKTDFGLVTREALPAGEPYRIVVQIRASTDAKPQNFRIDLNLGHCGGCQRAEYACTCETH